jgi:uncharacterized delta-60 repeat protein
MSAIRVTTQTPIRTAGRRRPAAVMLLALALQALAACGGGGSSGSGDGDTPPPSPPLPLPPPSAVTSLTLTVGPLSVSPGGRSTLSWSTTNATACAATGGWNGTRSTSGSEQTQALATPTTFTLTCTGASGQVSRSVTIEVTQNSAPPVNAAPIASAAAVSTLEDESLGGVLPAATDADGDSITYSLASPASNGAANVLPNGTYSYLPSPNFNGTDSFSYRVSDSRGASNTYIVRVTITPVNDAPGLVGGPFTFGLGDGIVNTTVDPNYDETRGIALQGDGKILVVGSGFYPTRGSVIILTRLNSDGTLDTGFGAANGVVVTLNAGGGTDVALQPDGKILVAGCASLCESTKVQFAVARYLENGDLDRSFGGGDGIATVALGQATTSFVQGENRSIALQSDGKILVAGYTHDGRTYDFAIVRFNADGTLDTGFGGGNGVVISPIGSDGDVAYDLALQQDGKIVVVGTGEVGTDTACAVARYTTDGSLDVTFGGGDGTVLVVPSRNFDAQCAAVEVLPGGKILAAGRATDGWSSTFEYEDVALFRFNSDGSLDSSFIGAGGSCPISNPTCRPIGVVFTPIGDRTSDFGTDLKLLENNKVLVVGGANAANSSAVLVRYNGDGTLDPTFGGGDGIVTTNITARADWAEAVAVQVDGKYVVAADVVPGAELLVVRYNSDGTLDQTFGKKNLVLQGAAFTFTLPAGRFFDVDGDLLTVTATLADGSPLPSWLQFDSNALTFSGVAPVGTPDLQLRVTAVDPGGLSVLDTFALRTSAP